MAIVIAGFLKNVSILFSVDVFSAKEPLMDEIVLGEVRSERRGGKCPFGRIGQERIQRILQHCEFVANWVMIKKLIAFVVVLRASQLVFNLSRPCC